MRFQNWFDLLAFPNMTPFTLCVRISGTKVTTKESFSAKKIN